MTPDQQIALISSLATVVAAVAALAAAVGTFMSVRQIKRQTESSYRPQLSIEQSTIHAMSESEAAPLPLIWKMISGNPNDNHYNNLQNYNYSLNIVNIGLATASNLNIIWHYLTSSRFFPPFSMRVFR